MYDRRGLPHEADEAYVLKHKRHKRLHEVNLASQKIVLTPGISTDKQTDRVIFCPSYDLLGQGFEFHLL